MSSRVVTVSTVVTVSATGITMRYPPGVGIGLKSTYREQWGSLAQGNALSKPAGDSQTRKGTRPSAYRNTGEVRPLKTRLRQEFLRKRKQSARMRLASLRCSNTQSAAGRN
jgi:hypothetical protein